MEIPPVAMGCVCMCVQYVCVLYPANEEKIKTNQLWVD